MRHSKTPQRQSGFLTKEIIIPDDFDHMFAAEIIDMFASDGTIPDINEKTVQRTNSLDK